MTLECSPTQDALHDTPGCHYFRFEDQNSTFIFRCVSKHVGQQNMIEQQKRSNLQNDDVIFLMPEMHHPILLSFLIMYLLKIDIEPLFFWGGGLGGPKEKQLLSRTLLGARCRGELWVSLGALGITSRWVGGLELCFSVVFFSNMGVSKNRGTPKWMVKIMENLKPY